MFLVSCAVTAGGCSGGGADDGSSGGGRVTSTDAVAGAAYGAGGTGDASFLSFLKRT